MSKKKDKKKEQDFLAQEAAESQATAEAYTLDIPDDEIWSYQIEGLQAPHINKPFKNAKRKKVIVVIILVLAIAAAIFLSVRAVHSDLYKYNELEDGTYELVKFSNRGDMKEVLVDYVVIDEKTGEKDTTKPITKIHEYAFNCDETVTSISFGKDVKDIDSKAIYSCWNLRSVYVDDENEAYCDLDGVVYNKDLTEIIHYPTAYDMHLMVNNGYATEETDENGYQKFVSKVTDENGNLTDADGNNLVNRVWGTNKLYDEKWFQTYNKTCRTYVIPSTVTSINDMSMAYSDIVDLYIPEGVTYMGTMALFKNTALTNIYTYKTDTAITDPTYKAIDQMTEVYPSLPNGLEFMGSDSLYYTRGLSYIFIPSTVKQIDHHALWDAVYKEGDELKGVTVINTDMDEAALDNVKKGNQWRPQYDYMLFKKSIDVNYNAERESQYNYNLHRQYFWYVQWMINNLSDEAKQGAGYLVQDLDNDGSPELVLRKTNPESKKTEDTVITFKYGYLDDFKGDADYSSATFSELTDNAQLDSILA